MLEANPRLTPGEVVTLLRATANPMPFEERVVGACYVDARNAVRAALELVAVAPPVELFPGSDTPKIIDARNDQIGTGAQDILFGDFVYDAASDQLVYTLTMADLSAKLIFNPGNQEVGLDLLDEAGMVVPTAEAGARIRLEGL